MSNKGYMKNLNYFFEGKVFTDKKLKCDFSLNISQGWISETVNKIWVSNCKKYSLQYIKKDVAIYKINGNIER